MLIHNEFKNSCVMCTNDVWCIFIASFKIRKIPWSLTKKNKIKECEHAYLKACDFANELLEMLLCSKWMLECIGMCSICLWTNLLSNNWTTLEYCTYFNSFSITLNICLLLLTSSIEQAVCEVIYKVSSSCFAAWEARLTLQSVYVLWITLFKLNS